MKVILNDYIEHLGERGDTVDVKPGYARNYLLPKKLAYLDTVGNRKLFAQEQKHWEEMDVKRQEAAHKIAEDLKGVSLIFERRAGEKDVLFGSVNVADIARSLEEKGFQLDRKRIQLDAPIKSLGSFEVSVQVHRETRVAIPIQVLRPGDQAEAAAPEGATDAVQTTSAEAEAVVADV
jgi:large subunit ribosomal protein L9